LKALETLGLAVMYKCNNPHRKLRTSWTRV